MQSNNDRKLILGVDGGGSKTLASIASVLPVAELRKLDLQIVGSGSSGPGNVRAVGIDQACCNIDKSICEAFQQAKLEFSAVGAICLSLAGAGRPEEKGLIRDWAVHRYKKSQIVVTDDIEPLRWAAKYEQSLFDSSIASDDWKRSITLVAGTGSIASGCDENDGAVRVGGWGYLLGDDGSGFAIGLSGLRSICRTHDQSSALTEMQRSLMKRIQIREPTQLVAWLYQSQIPRPLVADLATIILEYADRDAVAKAIVEQSVVAMIESVRLVSQRLSFTSRSYSLALSGGILKHHPWLVDRLLIVLERDQLAPLRTHVIEHPIFGALMIALRKYYFFEK
ncbi:MAG: BadF/BadG/BcrA/BcrD ATPase family protein [Pirellulaceae bacterium]|nr:BadF/BadG/BcrA/BcrD ATPase family protein [Pirellulaceae bacterium]